MPPAERQGRDEGGKRVTRLVLIVEDEEDVARYLAAALSDEGFETVEAPDARLGLDLAQSRHPDLICLDLVMPGRAGLSL